MSYGVELVGWNLNNMITVVESSKKQDNFVIIPAWILVDNYIN